MAHGDHLAHIHRDDAAMAKAVGEWLAPALRRGSGALLACTRTHARLVRDELGALGVDVASAAASGRLVVLEAEPLMARFMIDGQPDGARFHAILDAVLADIRAAAASAHVRAWGEMVDLLAQQGRFGAARELERLWAQALARSDVQLLCSYAAAHLQAGAADEVRALHDETVLQAPPAASH